jgi:hypothetical protein
MVSETASLYLQKKPEAVFRLQIINDEPGLQIPRSRVFSPVSVPKLSLTQSCLKLTLVIKSWHPYSYREAIVSWQRWNLAGHPISPSPSLPISGRPLSDFGKLNSIIPLALSFTFSNFTPYFINVALPGNTLWGSVF